MKNIKIFTTTMIIWTLALVFNLNTALADENIKVYEMGESGQIVSFPMTAEEIAAADCDNKKPAAVRKASAEKTRAAVLIYEVGEGGHRITFPLTRTNPDREDVLGWKPDYKAAEGSRSSSRNHKSDNRVLTFEMAESGLLIEFPMTVKVIVIGDENSIAARAEN
ncbi:MAG: hypothetical protein JRF72_19415 [Deltaproteobacteria bacterium]|nr:hypothetical protein [Deltaproteobacteria bacterium]